ncbi:hypothetical protein Gpo141_00004540 [Globisporangium polare]
MATMSSSEPRYTLRLVLSNFQRRNATVGLYSGHLWKRIESSMGAWEITTMPQKNVWIQSSVATMSSPFDWSRTDRWWYRSAKTLPRLKQKFANQAHATLMQALPSRITSVWNAERQTSRRNRCF